MILEEFKDWNQVFIRNIILLSGNKLGWENSQKMIKE